MTKSVFQLHLKPSQAQTFTLTLAGSQYSFTFVWNSVSACWMLSIADKNGAPLANSLPVVTGADVLKQLAYLGLVGHLIVQTDNNTDAVPTYDNLGIAGRVYYVTQ